MTCDGRSEGRVNSVDEIVHMFRSLHGVLHLLHGLSHLIHLSLQIWHPSSNGASGLISSFNVVLCPSIL